MYKIIITSSSVLAIGLYFGLQNQILALPKDQITISHEQIDDNAVEHPQPENAPEAVEPEPSEAKPDIFIKEPILEAKVELANEAEPVADLLDVGVAHVDRQRRLDVERPVDVDVAAQLPVAVRPRQRRA